MVCKPTVLIRKGVVNIAFGQTHVYTFENSGRLHAAFIKGRHYRRSLDHRLLESWRVKPRGSEFLRQRWIAGDEAVEIVGQIHAHANAGLASSKNTRERSFAEQVLNWTHDQYAKDATKFLNVYRPIGILPPDQYMSVVVQATEGCSWNRCSFCDFYLGRKFQIKTRDELDCHIEGVKAFFGAGLALRRSIFLADANALSIPFAKLIDIFESVKSHFSEKGIGPSWQQMAGFVDVWGGRRLERKEILVLKNMGLQKVYIGLETGHDPLLEKVNKRGSAELAIDLVNRFKGAGVSVGVIVLLGLGGEAYAQDHVWDTVGTLNQMELTKGDILYFSPLVAGSHLPYTHDMWAENTQALDDARMDHQFGEMVSALRFERKVVPKMAKYNIRRFVY